MLKEQSRIHDACFPILRRAEQDMLRKARALATVFDMVY